ncbi:MAG: diguanylate cyclase [Lysobacteraceae bacterium]
MHYRAGAPSSRGGCQATGDGRIWFGTPRGVLWIANEQVHAVDPGGALIGVLDLAQDASGRILAASESGLQVLENQHLRPDRDVAGPTYSLKQDGAVLWVGGIGVISRLGDGKVQRIALPDASLKITQIECDGDTLWLGTQQGLRLFDLRTHALTIAPQNNGVPIQSLLRDSNGNLWVGTVDQLARRRPSGAWELIESRDLFAQPWVDAIYEDREGSLWLGSHRESLVRLRDSAISYIGAREGLADPFTWSLLRDRDGSLLLGTSHGLIEIGNDGTPQLSIATDALPQGQVYALSEDPDGTLWIGTRGGLAVRRDGKVAVPPALAALKGIQINAIERVADDDHWIGALDGLFRYRNGRLDAIGPHGGTPASKVRTILPCCVTSASASDNILIGTEAGIFRVQNGRYTRLPGTEALNATFVSRLAWLKPGLLAITTMDRGLCLWRDGHLLLLAQDNGLPTANGWTLDVIGPYLYVASIDGVYRVALTDLPDPASKPSTAQPLQLRAQVVVEGRQRGGGGRRYDCCNGGGDARTLREGTVLWIASSAGAVRLDTPALPGPAASPAALIERVRNGSDSYEADQPLRLDGASRDLEIDYTGVSLADSARTEFRYRLDGYDRDWHVAGTRRVAFYTQLPPGEYRFQVQARPPFGVWGISMTPLSITLVPHWYERTDVRLLGALLLIVLIMLGIRHHNRVLRRRTDELQLAVDERTTALREANASLKQLSRTDSLTGLENRRALDTQTPGAERDWTGAALLIDLDHFKRVNDEHGHARGDDVIVTLGEILRANTRVGDRVLRWGGEEFLIVSQRLGIDSALTLAERIRTTMAEHRFRANDGNTLRVTCSIGIASLPVHPDRAGDLDASIALADFALYRAKREGRDRVYAAELPADAAPGTSRSNLHEEAERLDACGKLVWRTIATAPPAQP